ncbi:hypothetical protein RJT34_15985 [Clitoria ternatea]|uniref:Uncharacterized protein n=1 Tax=Clitoria ternatea TaxID=43366 RepID=A0AAN9J9D9_CLITE
MIGEKEKQHITTELDLSCMGMCNVVKNQKPNMPLILESERKSTALFVLFWKGSETLGWVGFYLAKAPSVCIITTKHNLLPTLRPFISNHASTVHSKTEAIQNSLHNAKSMVAQR